MNIFKLFSRGVLEGGGGGGGAKNKVQDTIPNFEELIESITNMLLFFAGGCGEKSYEVSKFGGGGGIFALNELKKKINSIFFCNIMTTSYCS